LPQAVLNNIVVLPADRIPTDLKKMGERIVAATSPRMLRGLGGIGGFMLAERWVPDNLPHNASDYAKLFLLALAGLSAIIALIGVWKGD
jgi:hypothetical protein